MNSEIELNNIIEVINKTCTKYTASKFIAEHFGINEDEVITIGDSTNDLALLDFGFPIAVASGSDLLKQKAKYMDHIQIQRQQKILWTY